VPCAGRGDAVVAEPRLHEAVGLAVLIESDGRSHINNSVDEFGLLHFRHGLVAAQEFGGGQVRAVFQRWDAARGNLARHGL
jgi:hypothetical protein